MAITINNGVQNILGTPGAISGVFSDRPAATDIAEGTLYFSTDTTTIYQVDNGAWIVYTGGGGGGGVSAVTGTKPISSTGGATPDVSISQSTATTDGYLDFQDWNTFNNKIGGSGVATQVAFFTAANTIGSNSQLFWDNTTNRLGVGGTPLGYKLTVLDANYYARFGTTAGSDANAVTFGKSTSAGIGLFGPASERKMLIGDGTTGYANFTAYTDNIIQFSYSNATGGAQLSSALTLFSGNFFYTTGTNSHTQIYLKPSIQTSGGTNLLRGIYYAPIKTEDIGTTQIAWENTEGEIIFGNLASGSTPITFVDTDGKLGNSYLFNDTINQKLYSQNSGDDKGISLDFLNNVYKFGAYDYNNGTTLFINDNFNVAYFLNVYNGSAGAQGMYMDFRLNRYVFGDVSNTTNGINIELNNQDKLIFATFNNVQNGLLLNFDLLDYYLGDVNNFTSFVNVNATDNKIFFVTPAGKYNFQNVPRYNDNADALANGLIVGDIYRTPDTLGTSNLLKIVV